MGGSQKGISFRDLLCGLVVLTKGELEEKIKCMLLRFCVNCISVLFGNCLKCTVCMVCAVIFSFLQHVCSSHISASKNLQLFKYARLYV